MRGAKATRGCCLITCSMLHVILRRTKTKFLKSLVIEWLGLLYLQGAICKLSSYTPSYCACYYTLSCCLCCYTPSWCVCCYTPSNPPVVCVMTHAQVRLPPSCTPSPLSLSISPLWRSLPLTNTCGRAGAQDGGVSGICARLRLALHRH